MSKIDKLNRIFLAELGDEPRFEWIHAHSKKLWIPVEVVDRDTMKPILDQHCVCGIDKRVHKPECRMSVMVPRHEIKPLGEVITTLKPFMERNHYIVCKERSITKPQWEATFHSLAYPGHGIWAPVTSNGMTLALAEPDEDATYNAIALIKEGRNTSWIELRNRIDDRIERRHRATRTERREILRELRPVRPFPGKVDGHVSLPTVPR